MKQRLGRESSLVVVMLFFVVGCGGGALVAPKLPDLVSFSGTVTMDDKPLEGATVMFIPKMASVGYHGMSATTDASGKYELETDIGNNKKKKGAIPGTYQVTVSKSVAATTSVGVDPTKPIPVPEAMGASQVDMKYSMTGPDNPIPVVEVPATGGSYDIKVTSAQMPKSPGQ